MFGHFAFYFLDFSWWWFIGLFFAPDTGAIGYVFNAKIGAFLYNLFHPQGLTILFWGIGFYLHLQVLQLIGVILFSHSAFDCILGYGLKYEKGFKFTHLGEIGK